MLVSIARLGVLMACALTVVGCRSYRAEPFDVDAFGRAWRERSADDATVADFAERLARSSPTSRPTTTPATQFSIADGLTLTEARAIALVYNPSLRVARLRAGVLRARADHAGLWADPVLGVDGERIISGVDDPWVVGGTLNITVPISGRLDAEKRRAGAEHVAELIRVAGQEWALTQRLRDAWAEWSTQADRVELLHALVQRLDSINSITDRLAEAGALTRIEARLFRIERATRQAEQIDAVARLEERRLELHAMLGLVPTADVRLLPEVSAPISLTAVNATDADLAARNFAVRAAAADYETAERTLRREIRAQYPDLVIGPGFGTDEGDERVLLGLSLPLPLWNRNQQGVAEAIAGRDLARAELETSIEVQTSAVAVARLRYEAAVRQRGLLESTIAPAADEQAADAGRLAELGDVDAVLLLDAFVRQHAVKLRLLDARLAEVQAATRVAELNAADAVVNNHDLLPERTRGSR